MWKRMAVGCAVTAVLGVGGYIVFRHFKERREASRALKIEYMPYNKEEVIKRLENNAKDKNPDWDSRHLPNRDSYAERLRNYNGDKNFEAYMAEMESPEESEEEDDDADPDDPEIFSNMDIPGEGPREITADEFANTRTYYDKLSYDYYIHDNVMLDDKGDPIGNPERMLGDFRKYLQGDEIPNTIYIRNEGMETDFEIVPVNSSYRKDVLKEESQ